MSAAPSYRRSKIARLPRALRDELNRRIAAGERGSTLLTWLNEQPPVRAAIETQFKGEKISTGNLSEWKLRGGYLQWQEEQAAFQERHPGLTCLAESAIKLATARAEAVQSGMDAVELAPLVVESAQCQVNEHREPVLVLVVNGVAAFVNVFTLAWLAQGAVPIISKDVRFATIRLPGRIKPIKNATADFVIVEMARRLLCDYREERLFTGPREIPTLAEAKAARWEINVRRNTIRKEGGADQ